MRGAPNVKKAIVDYSEVVEGPGVTKAAMVIPSDRGRCNQRMYMQNQRGFRDEFGKEDGVRPGHYAALTYLEQGKVLYVVRPVPTEGGALYAGVKWYGAGSSVPVALGEGSETGLADDGEGEPDVSGYAFGADEVMLVTAANPGAWGDGVAVTIDDVDAVEHTFYLSVYEQDSDGNWDEVGESPWLCSRVAGKKDGYGNSLYVEDVINGNSAYVWVYDNEAIDEETDPDEYSTELAFGGGDDGTDPSHVQIVAAWDTYFANPDEVELDILMTAGQTANEDDTLCAKLISICRTRLDCFAAMDVPYDKTPAQAIVWRDALSLGLKPYFGAFYYDWGKTKCTQTDTDVYVPPSAYAGAVCAYCDANGTAWDAPMGTNRGMISALDVEYTTSQADRDLLYEAEINFLRKKAGKGVYIDGQRTAQTKRSSLSEVRAVRGLVSIMRGVHAFLEDFKGEQNNEFTRQRIATGIAEVFRPIQQLGHLDSYQVVCDETNNPDYIRQANRLVVDGYVKITPTAEEIDFNAVVVRSEGVLLSY